MIASAPSSTALAQSEASARVGRGRVIIESSTWVATITGLAARRARWTARFCTIGTCSSGSSTPRSPRATMIPSKAWMISSRLSTACGFSILAITGTRRPTSSMILCTSATSTALRTKDSATRSTPIRRAKRRSSSSFSDRAGTLTAIPGRLRPLWLEIAPPTSTRVITSVSVGLHDAQGDLAVVHQDRVPRAAVPRQPGVGGGGALRRARNVMGGDHEAVAVGQCHRAVGEHSEPDLRPLQVDQDADRLLGGVAGGAHLVVVGLVVLVGPVAEVEPGDVHPGVHQLLDPPGHGWTRCANDLGSTHGRRIPLVCAVDGAVWWAERRTAGAAQIMS